jgi:hypothetical protein
MAPEISSSHVIVGHVVVTAFVFGLRDDGGAL